MFYIGSQQEIRPDLLFCESIKMDVTHTFVDKGISFLFEKCSKEITTLL